MNQGRQSRAELQVERFERAAGSHVVELAMHAAVAVAVNPELVHLLRINFFLDPPAPILPFDAEWQLLLSPLCREIDDGLYELEHDVRQLLLERLVAAERLGPQRLRDVATLLWQYCERSTWADRPELERAQQLTALGCLDAYQARAWLEQERSREGSPVDRRWFVAMQQDVEELTASITPRRPLASADAAHISQLLETLDFRDQRTTYAVRHGEPFPVFLVQGPPGHGQRWLSYLLARAHARATPPSSAVAIVVPAPVRDDHGAFDDALLAELGVVRGESARAREAHPWDLAVEAIDARLRRGASVTLIVDGVDRSSPVAMRALLTDFWRERITPLTETLAVHPSSRLQMLLLDEQGSWDRPTGREPAIRALPPIEAFHPKVIDGWLQRHYTLVPPSFLDSASEVFASVAWGSEGALPERALELICRRCGVEWADVLDAARPSAALPAVPDDNVGRLLALAAEFDETRRGLRATDERDGRMDRIRDDMRKSGPIEHQVLDGLTKSRSVGERLAAVVALEKQPDARYLGWLARRFVGGRRPYWAPDGGEPPYIGVQAGFALISAARSLPHASLHDVEKAVATALQTLGDERGKRQSLLRNAEQIVKERRRADPSGSAQTPAPDRVAVRTHVLNLWPNGTALRIRFLDGSRSLQARVMRVAHEWTRYANLSFVTLGGEAAGGSDIRISFEGEGTWSVEGPAHDLAEDAPTMNLGWLGAATSDEEFTRVVLHEFGHALGLVHEHQNVEADLRWRETRIRADMSGPPNNWTPERIDAYFFTRYRIESYRPFDPASIMMNPVDGRWLETGRSIPGGSRLSASDKALIARLYPAERQVRARILRVALESLGIELVEARPAASWIPYADGDETHGPFVTTRGRHDIHLPPVVRIGRHLVTNAHFLRFVIRGGYQNDALWTIDRRERRQFVTKDGTTLGPAHWSTARQVPTGQEDHPVSSISFLEAKSFVSWCNQVASPGSPWTWSLAPEDVWEFAARSEQGLLYPWGNTFLPGRCNSSEAGLGGTSRVTEFESGASGLGCCDMAGNLWEFVDAEDSRRNRCVLRGGSYTNNQSEVRSHLRLVSVPQAHRPPDFGFRLAQTAGAGVTDDVQSRPRGPGRAVRSDEPAPRGRRRSGSEPDA